MRFIREGDRVAVRNYSGRPPARLAKDVAIEKAIEAQRCRVIKLTCGHTTDWDIDLVYEVFRPLGPITHFCEKCQKWVTRKESEITPSLPADPLF